MRLEAANGLVISGTPAARVYKGGQLILGTASPSDAISLSLQPSDVSVLEGESASLSVQASHALGYTLFYQWERSADSGVTWSNVAGATSSSLAWLSVAPSDDGLYRVRVSDALGGQRISQTATLTVQLLPAQAVTASSTGVFTFPDSGSGYGEAQTLKFGYNFGAQQPLALTVQVAGTYKVLAPLGRENSGIGWSGDYEGWSIAAGHLYRFPYPSGPPQVLSGEPLGYIYTDYEIYMEVGDVFLAGTRYSEATETPYITLYRV